LRTDNRMKRLAEFSMLALAFVTSTYAVSNLMPLLLSAATRGFSIGDGILIVLYLAGGSVATVFLARAIYRLDKRAGRIRNKVGWFE